MVSREEIVSKLTSEGPFQIVPDNSQGYALRVYKNAPRSLREVLETTKARGNLPYLLYRDEVLSYREFYGRVAALAQHLVASGVKKGDRVALGMRNYPEWSICFWACQAIGAIVVSLNAWWTGAELEYALNDSEPVALLIDGERLERLRPLLDKMKLATVVVVRRGGSGPGGLDLSDIPAAPGDALPAADIGPDDMATILYTSGTTGNPKGAMATQRNHLTNLTNSLLNGAVGRVMAGMPAEAPEVTPETQPGMLQTFPFFHIGGLSGLLVATATGMKMGLLYKWAPMEAIEIIESHKLSSAAGVPIVVRQLLETASEAGRDLSTLLGITSGGAPVPPDLINRIGEQFQAKAMPGNGYGLTETTSAVIINGGMEYLENPDSVGRAVPTADIRIVDDEGQDKPQGEIGEVWVRGPNVIPGYWRNPTATEQAFGGGWFRTGDLGYVDPNGLYYVVDRKKDVIIRGGENVYCAEVEAMLLAQPEVRDAALIGLPHREYGEEVAAVIQVAAADLRDTLAEELVERLADRLARFKIPSVVKFTESELPRTATGKILKREMRGMYFPDREKA